MCKQHKGDLRYSRIKTEAVMVLQINLIIPNGYNIVISNCYFQEFFEQLPNGAAPLWCFLNSYISITNNSTAAISSLTPTDLTNNGLCMHQILNL